MDQRKTISTVKSAAAESLIFVASAGEDGVGFEVRYENKNIWLTQNMMAALYDVGSSTINEHIKKIYDDGELMETATIRKFRLGECAGREDPESDGFLHIVR